MDNFWNELWQMLLGMLKSRTFWMAAVAIIYTLFGDRAGIGSDALVAAIMVIVAYIFGEGASAVARRL